MRFAPPMKITLPTLVGVWLMSILILFNQLILTPLPGMKKSAPLSASPLAPKRRPMSFTKELPSQLGEFVSRDEQLLQQLGWRGLVSLC